ncbi:MAG: phosphate transport system substrate-binding protein [Actinomycetota bacterium]|nr:phosphate transport system substrate-binding protein [Actinomycetota bacterium]
MKHSRSGRLAGVAVVGTLALAGCGSDDNSDGSPTGSSSASGTIDCASGTINSSGSTAQSNAMTQWIKEYQTACGDATINYTGGGSGQGITDFSNGQTAFAGSDSALNPDKGEVAKADARCKTGKALNIPMVAGPIAVVYNLEGVDGLVLTPSVLAKIFSGKITTWNDPQIAKLNSGVSLPSTKITSVHRSDSSGTTSNVTKYLEAAAKADWTFGHDKQWKAPGGQGAAKSDGIAAAVKSAPNTISYVEWSYATESDLSIAKIDNGGGAVELTADAVSKAVAAAEVTGTGDDLTMKLDYATKVPGAYPLLLVTYEITCQKGLQPEQATLVKSFLTHTASEEGQAKLVELGYAPLPTEILAKVQKTVATIS